MAIRIQMRRRNGSHKDLVQSWLYNIELQDSSELDGMAKDGIDGNPFRAR
jgi:hypothetical protein